MISITNLKPASIVFRLCCRSRKLSISLLSSFKNCVHLINLSEQYKPDLHCQIVDYAISPFNPFRHHLFTKRHHQAKQSRAHSQRRWKNPAPTKHKKISGDKKKANQIINIPFSFLLKRLLADLHSYEPLGMKALRAKLLNLRFFTAVKSRLKM